MNITESVRDILARSTITDTTLKLPEQLDRADYVATDKVLKIAGGKWNRARRVHVFPSDPRALLGMAVESGTITDKKRELQAFYTPPELADIVAEEASVLDDETVLEPSSGGGAIVHALVRAGVRPDQITSLDIDPQATPMPGVDHHTSDFLNLDAVGFDVVVMNPPFAKGQAVTHLSHALKLAARRVVAIMPAGWETSPRKAVVDLLAQLDDDYSYSIDPLPEGSFKEAGTLVRVSLLVAERDGAL
jgi:predicted RNA methylase